MFEPEWLRPLLFSHRQKWREIKCNGFCDILKQAQDADVESRDEERVTL
jgi:hypothetical protein